MLKGSSLKSPNGKAIWSYWKAIWSIEKTSKEVEAMYFESNGNSVFWQSGAKGSKATLLDVQNDGNVVIRDDDRSALWDTKTYDKCGKPGNFFVDFLDICFSFFSFFFFFPLHFYWEDLSVANINFKGKRFLSI